MAATALQVNQWSTVKPLVSSGEFPNWVPESERDRLAAYLKYEQMYWSSDQAFRLMTRGAETKPIYIPNPRIIVDNTAHYLLKGLTVQPEKAEKNKDFTTDLDAFLERESFFANFNTAKHNGVVKGDYIFHITADPEKPEGKRISLTAIDPSRYFPITDDDDIDKVIKVHIAEQFKDSDRKERVRRLTYWYATDTEPGEKGSRVWRQEAVYESDDKWSGDQPTLKRWIHEPEPLPEEITTIPVYHFKNIDWTGEPFGSSEIRGHERLAGGINQTVSDEDLALVLEGLGVYATDGGSPIDDKGNKTAWVISPARVMEVPAGSYFKRVEGIGSIKPIQDHVEYLENRLHESAASFRAGQVEVQVAESGIALSIRFLPTLAKVETRDLYGVGKLKQMFFDWKGWWAAYENTDYRDIDIDIKLGDKLPINRKERFAELNNMLDRNVISRAYYRTEVKKLGYDIPDDMEKEVLDEMEKFTKFKPMGTGEPQEGPVDAAGNPMPVKSGNPDNPNAPTMPKGNQSNNARRPNESNGSEAGRSGPSRGRQPA